MGSFFPLKIDILDSQFEAVTAKSALAVFRLDTKDSNENHGPINDAYLPTVHNLVISSLVTLPVHLEAYLHPAATTMNVKGSLNSACDETYTPDGFLPRTVCSVYLPITLHTALQELVIIPSCTPVTNTYITPGCTQKEPKKNQSLRLLPLPANATNLGSSLASSFLGGAAGGFPSFFWANLAASLFPATPGGAPPPPLELPALASPNTTLPALSPPPVDPVFEVGASSVVLLPDAPDVEAFPSILFPAPAHHNGMVIYHARCLLLRLLRCSIALCFSATIHILPSIPMISTPYLSMDPVLQREKCDKRIRLTRKHNARHSMV